MEGIRDDTTKDEIKEALMDQFSVEADDFAYMEFKKGQNSCQNGQNQLFPSKFQYIYRK